MRITVPPESAYGWPDPARVDWLPVTTLDPEGRVEVGMRFESPTESGIVVAPSGEVRVTYQDATAGTLHYAVGVGGADKHTWTVKVVPQDGFAGAFSSIIEVDGKLQLVNWWRTGGKKVAGDVAVVAP
mgnify:CR=1 FL=1